MNQLVDRNWKDWQAPAKQISKAIFLTVIVITMCSGCYSKRLVSNWFIRYEERQVETIKNAKEATKLMLQEWPFRSGVLHGALQNRMDDIPVQTVEAFRELNAFAEKYSQGGLDDYELGRALGLRMQMINGSTKEIINEYAPSVFKYLPL